MTSWDSIYPSEVIKSHFCLKNSIFFISIKSLNVWAVLPYELQKKSSIWWLIPSVLANSAKNYEFVYYKDPFLWLDVSYYLEQ